MCPHCGTPMIILELEGIEIDYCIDCGGTWLDSGELELLAELEEVSTERLTDLIGFTPAKTRSKRRCPRCNSKMDTIEMGDKKIEIERCARGHGLWFDEGETYDVISSFKDGEEGMVGKFFAELYKNKMKSHPEGE